MGCPRRTDILVIAMVLLCRLPSTHVLGFPFPDRDALCRLSAILFAKYSLWRASASVATGVTGDQRAGLSDFSDSSSTVELGGTTFAVDHFGRVGPWTAAVVSVDANPMGNHPVLSFVTVRWRLSAFR